MSKKIIGVDEAGRGPWAGPMVVVALLAGDDEVSFAKDSKSLTHQKRSELKKLIDVSSAVYGIGLLTNKEIDSLGLKVALEVASKRAFSAFSKLDYDIVVDGSYNFTGLELPNLTTKVKADASVPQVSAASIVAKVTRDEWMREYAKAHPQWDFDQHMGYGTKLHKELIEKHGLSDIHRRSYKPIKQYEESNKQRKQS